MEPKAAVIVDAATSDKQVEMLAQIFTGKLGGMPWELLGPTFEVVGLAGQGSFGASAAGVSVDFNTTNWIYYQYDWSNAA